MTELTALAARMQALVDQHPDGIPVEYIETEIRRVKELAFMVREGLTIGDD